MPLDFINMVNIDFINILLFTVYGNFKHNKHNVRTFFSIQKKRKSE